MNGLHLWLIPILPLVGFLLNGLLGHRLPKALVSTNALLFTAAPFLLVLHVYTSFSALSLPYIERHSAWIATSAFHADFAFALDQLTLVMLLIVTGVGFLIHVYSVGYMAHEEGYWRFFAYLNLFMFFMLTLVLAENFLLMFVGWEGVGLASYLLIGFYFKKHSAVRAGIKAFVVNRIGDFGFLLAMFLLIIHFGTLSFSEVTSQIAQHPDWHGGVLTAIALLLVLGATGKSAQIPLYIWLPDAMEGPTPVSALIHAATMVTAGVYMVVRTHALFDRAPLALTVVAVIGAATAFFAATVGIVQTDIKRVLAYSTISQLGYMFLACGAAAYSAAIFHLLTHAFFKALLFLAAGSVIHAVGGEQDMRLMGGLRRYIPVTFWTMTMAVFAISGFPPFAGFFSKDEILAEVFRSPNGGPLLWTVGVVTAAITSFYMFRLWYLTFFGRLRLPSEAAAPHGAPPAALDDQLVATAHSIDGHPAQAHGIHESPWSMLLPLVLLAFLSFTGGWIGIPHALGGSDRFAHFLDPVTHGTGVPASFEQVSIAMRTGAPIPTTEPPTKPEDPQTERVLTGCSVLAALLGWLLADTLYRRKPQLPARMAASSRMLYGLVLNKYWIDEVYAFLVVKPILVISRYILWGGFDRGVVGGGNRVLAGAAQGAGSVLRRIQSGNIRSYAGWLAIGAAAILLLSFFGFGTHIHMGVR
ncbi:MAG TPA: NADH-quinone oxidoreductase subunit L [Acidobacteriaceae bacterium]|jgi:NADH-quinone oxidoreductase subunit L|nr:NADH-quinone oxidoreductase subunit L [Acidobacteriaceae bacterium]